MTAAQAAQQNNRGQGGRYATKIHDEAPFTAPTAATVVGVGDLTSADARLYVASCGIRDELRFNGVVSGLAPARRLPDGNVEVDIEAGQYPDTPLWVASEGDVSAFLTDTDDGLRFDVGAAQDRFGKLQAVADDTINDKIREKATTPFAKTDELLHARPQLLELEKRVAHLSGQYILADLREVAPAAHQVVLSRDSEGQMFIATVANADGEEIYSWSDAHSPYGGVGEGQSALAEQVAYLVDSTRSVEDACRGMRRETIRTITFDTAESGTRR